MPAARSSCKPRCARRCCLPQARCPHPLMRFWVGYHGAGLLGRARLRRLRGFHARAWRCVQSVVGDAEAVACPASLCYALSHGGCLVALWVGNLAGAERYAEMLL